MPAPALNQHLDDTLEKLTTKIDALTSEQVTMNSTLHAFTAGSPHWSPAPALNQHLVDTLETLTAKIEALAAEQEKINLTLHTFTAGETQAIKEAVANPRDDDAPLASCNADLDPAADADFSYNENIDRKSSAVQAAATNQTMRITFRNMSAEEVKILKSWDVDNDGNLCAAELIGLVKSELTLQKQNKRLRWVVLALQVAVVILISAMFGTSVWAAEFTKETHTSNGGLMTSVSGEPVVVGEARAEFALLDLPKASNQVLLSLDKLQLETINGVFFVMSVAYLAREKDALKVFGSPSMWLEISADSAALTVPDGQRHVVRTSQADGRRLKDANINRQAIKISKSVGPGMADTSLKHCATFQPCSQTELNQGMTCVMWPKTIPLAERNAECKYCILNCNHVDECFDAPRAPFACDDEEAGSFNWLPLILISLGILVLCCVSWFLYMTWSARNYGDIEQLAPNRRKCSW